MKIIKVIKDKKKINYKILQKTKDNFIIESGYYDLNEKIVCISTQIGCKNHCIFCYNNKKDFVRNLKYKEIIEQVENILNLNQPTKKRILFSYSGMGEPFDNYKNVIDSIKFLINKYKNSRVTITTVGNNPNLIRKLSNEKLNTILKVHLSLHAPDNVLRNKLIPTSKRVEETLNSLYYFYKKRKTIPKINYILIKGINDKKEQLDKLINIVKSYPFIVKLIYLSKIENLKPSSEKTFKFFENELKKHNIKCCRFIPSGRLISSGCGQLKYEFLKRGN